MDVYTMSIEDAQKFAKFLEGMRANNTFTECIGIGPGDRETNSQKSYVYPYREYGTPRRASLLVSGNTFSFMMLYDQFRIAYTLQAQGRWEQIDFDSYGGTYLTEMPTSFDSLTAASLSKITSLFDGKFRLGANNLYNILGNMAHNIYFLEGYIRDIYQHQ